VINSVAISNCWFMQCNICQNISFCWELNWSVSMIGKDDWKRNSFMSSCFKGDKCYFK